MAVSCPDGCFICIAKFALRIYFGTSETGSMYDAAGSVILIMLWASYSGLIVLLGADSPINIWSPRER